jgi:plasmid stability protein
MGQLIVRNIDADLVQRLKQRAAAHGRSAEAEHRLILERALRLSAEEFRTEARRLQEELGETRQSDSTKLVRASRDRGWR